MNFIRAGFLVVIYVGDDAHVVPLYRTTVA